MINQRNYAYFSPQKCDCCKRVRQIKTKIEVLDEEGGLVGEMALCPTCLKAFKGEVSGNQIPGPTRQISDVIPQSMTEYDDDDLDLEDYSKLGYDVQKLI